MTTLRILAMGLVFVLPTLANADAPSMVAPAGSGLLPVVTAPALLLVSETYLVTFVVTAADPDQDTITSLTASGLPSGATFTLNGTNTSGVFSWTPTISQSGEYDIVFTASNVLSGLATTHIRVLRRPHQGFAWIGPIDEVSVSEGGSVKVTVGIYDPDAATVSLSTSGLPPFATLDPPTSNTGSYFLQTTITITPEAGTAGSYPMTLTATSTGGCEGEFCSINHEEFTIHVVQAGSDLPPALSAPSLLLVKRMHPLTFAVTATDPDQDAITSLTASVPSGATFTPNETHTSGTLTWTPPIDPDAQITVYDIVFTASNALSSSATTRVLAFDRLNLNPLSIRPVDDVSVSEGRSVTVALDMSDPDGGTISLGATGLPSFATLNPPTTSDTGTLQTTLTIAPEAGTAGSYPVVLSATSVGECDPPLVGGGAELVCDSDTEEFWITVTEGGLVELETVATMIGRFHPHRKSLCFRISQDGTPFDLRDVDLGSITLAFEGRTIQALSTKASNGGCKADEDCKADQVRICFSMGSIRSLFEEEDIANRLSNSELHGTLKNGETFVADIVGENLADGSGDPLKLHVRPNPLNPAADISFTLVHPGNVRISLYDVHGRLVKTILDERRPVGDHEVRWDGLSMNGQRVASGVYFLKIRTLQSEEERRVTVLK